MAEGFVSQKKRVLGRADRSKKGGVDAPIAGLIDALNSSPAYFTTSSCSGRIVVFGGSEVVSVLPTDIDGSDRVGKKQGRWWYVTHHDASTSDLMASLAPHLGDAKFSGSFKFEPMVLHVQCRTMDDAKEMLRAAVASGFRNSGITIGRKQRVILAVRSTHGLEVPIIHQGKLLVSQEYIEYLVDIANGRMLENKQRIDRLHTNLNGILASTMVKQGILSHEEESSLRQKMSDDSSSIETQAASVHSPVQKSPSFRRTNQTGITDSCHSGDESSEEEDLILPWEQT